MESFIGHFHSQANQDAFVSACFEHKRNGTFLDIGAGDPFIISNTAMLERDLGWHGICCDIATHEKLRANRSAIVVEDAFNEDWGTLAKSIAIDGKIDYLSLDLEPPIITLCALINLPLADIRFGVITIEHDAYRGFDDIRTAMRAILLSHRYTMVASNVKVTGLPFEDWWIDSDLVDLKRAEYWANEINKKSESA